MTTVLNRIAQIEDKGERAKMLNAYHAQMEMISNISTQRHRLARALGGLDDNKKNYNAECGFPDVLDDKILTDLVKRNGYAEKAVSLYPNHTWKVVPEVLENAESEETEFEQAFKDLHSKLRISNLPADEFRSSFRDSESSPIWDVFKRAMRLANIDSKGYSVILMGFSMSDSESMETAVEPNEGKELLYLTPLAGKDAQIASWYDSEEEKGSALYRKPKTYNITIEESGHQSTTTTTMTVHHSRVIHVCQNPESSEIISCSLLEKIFDPLYGTRKIVGAAPEGFWKQAFTKMLLEANQDVTPADVDLKSMKDDIHNWENNLSQTLGIFGFTGKAIAPQASDPGPHMDMLTEWISASLECPKRIFLGTERGELASSQDKQEWNEVVSFFQVRVVSPYIIAPFIDLLIWAKVLPEPPEGFFIKWPELNKQSRAESAEVASKRTDAMVKFVQGGVADSLMTVMDFLTRELDYSQEEALEIIENFEGEVADGLDGPEPGGDDDNDPVDPSVSDPGNSDE